MKSKLVIVSRSSNLALKQVEIITKKLSRTFDIELIKVRTTADKNLKQPLYKIGGKGLFVKELEKFLIERKADLAIHSLKDMETELAKDTCICAVTKSTSKYDVLLSNYDGLSLLPKNAIIGTSSPRRTAFLKAFRSDFIIKICRGNIETRIEKLNKGKFDALVLAEAGLKRLKIKYKSVIPFKIIPPAAGQGAIAIQCHNKLEKQKKEKIISLINNKIAYFQSLAERSLVKNLNGSCKSPISAEANTDKFGNITLKASVSNFNGTKIISDEMVGGETEAEALGKKLAKSLMLKGAKNILKNTI